MSIMPSKSDKPHKYKLVNESTLIEREDKKYTDEARRIYENIREWLGKYLKDNEFFPESPSNDTFRKNRDGEWLLHYGAIDPNNEDLYVLFTNHKGHSGFGYFKGTKTPVIILNGALLEDGTPRYLNTRMSGYRQQFIHEVIHYLDSKRFKNKNKTKSAGIYDSGDKSGYYNEPSEMNAYYQEFADDLRGMWSNQLWRDHFKLETWNGMLNYFKTRTAKNFYDNLTDENKKRMQKRLYELWKSLMDYTLPSDTIEESKSLTEEFFEYASDVFIYKNPTETEWKKYVPEGARGYIDPEGNLYMEGYEDKAVQPITMIMHFEFLDILSKKLPFITREYTKLYYKSFIELERKFGVCVQRRDNEDTIVLSESLLETQQFDQENVEYLFKKSESKNGYLSFELEEVPDAF